MDGDSGGQELPPTVGCAHDRSRGRVRATVAHTEPGSQYVDTEPLSMAQYVPATEPRAEPMVPALGMPDDRASPVPSEASSLSSVDGIPGLATSFDKMAVTTPPSTVPPTRPPHISDKKGTSGYPIKIAANHFRLESRSPYCVHQYHLEFVPPEESSYIRRQLLMKHVDMFDKWFLFDGISDLKTRKRFPEDITEVYSNHPIGDGFCCIRIKWVREVDPISADLLRLFDTEMGRKLESLNFLQLNRHFFDKESMSIIPQHGLEVWQGLVTAIGQYESGIMLVVDMVHKVVQRDHVLDLMMQLSGFIKFKEDEVMRKVVGCFVFMPSNGKTYRVDDIDWGKNPMIPFETKKGFNTFAEYYTYKYGKFLRDMNQPLLVCRPEGLEEDLGASPTQNIYLAPELCNLMGLTDEMRVNVTVMRDLAQHMVEDPSKRMRYLLQFIGRVNGKKAVLDFMGVCDGSFDSALVTIDARVLPPERVMQGVNTYRYSATTADFSCEARDQPLHVAVAIESWIVVYHRRDEHSVTEFVRNLMSVCSPMGITIGQPQMLQLDDDKAGNYVRALREVGDGENYQLALVVVPNNRKDHYDLIMKEACVVLGLPTQVILASTIANRKNIRSVATKLAVQLNCKLGGEAWCVETQLDSTMVIGCDTYDDWSACNRPASAFVASMNKNLTRWYSRVSFHTTHQELGNSLAALLRDALQKYSECNNGASPERIIFFRDGVSERQIEQVKEWEIDQIVSCLQAVFPGVALKLAFVVVTKRTPTRFFVPDESANEASNPPPGTVVDSVVTRPGQYEFFLVSQSVRQGTVVPTHYNVIHDTTDLLPDDMQRLAYKLTHLYFNWPGTISVPAPCQYAHELAILAGQSLHEEHNPRLSSTLFYL